MKTDKLKELTLEFGISIIELSKKLTENNQFALANQIIRSGTSIGANIREAKYAQSRADFVSKLKIALKEANETDYWLELLYKTNYISQNEYDILAKQCKEIRITLINSINTTQKMGTGATRP